MLTGGGEGGDAASISDIVFYRSWQERTENIGKGFTCVTTGKSRIKLQLVAEIMSFFRFSSKSRFCLFSHKNEKILRTFHQ